jgi:TM2 domain-containing membrane protein YozV
MPATLNHIEQPEHQPGMALLLSLILCGTGQIYNGEVSKGITMMVLCFLLWFALLGWVVHIWSIVDAVVVAERMSRQQHMRR